MDNGRARRILMALGNICTEMSQKCVFPDGFDIDPSQSVTGRDISYAYASCNI